MIAVDSSVVVAGLLSWHEFHERALKVLEKAMAAGPLLIPFPVLVESYSVMTRLPFRTASVRKSPISFCTTRSAALAS